MSWQSGMPDNNFNGHINPNANGNMAPLPPAWALTAADVCFSERCPGDCGKRTHLSLFVPVHVQLNRLQQQQQHQTLHSPTPPQPPQLKQHCGTPRGDRMAPLQHHVGVQIPTPVRVAPSANGNGAWPTPGNGAASGGVNRALQTSTLSCTTDRDSGNESSLTAASNHTPPIDSAQSPGSQQHQVQLGGAASTQLIGHGILASILRTQAGDMGACAPWGGASPGWGGWQHRSHSPAAVSLSSVDLSEESRSRSSSKSSTDMAQLKFSMQHILSRGQPPAAKQPQIAQRGELTDKKTAVAEINSNPKDVPSQSTSAATCRSPPPTPSTSTPLSRHRQLAVSNLNASVASGGGEIVTSVRECSSPRKPVPRTVTLPSMTIPKTTLRSPGNVPNSGSPGCGPTIVQCVAPMPPNAPCVVCTDRASGYHYGVISCEGCKGFFRRTVKKDVVYQCHKSGECPVNRSTRNRCQACRFNKCLRCGMNRDWPINSVDYILAELRSGAAGTRDFAGKLPGFDELCPNDREVLMNSAAVEIVIIRASALPPQTGENSDSKMEPLNTVLRACEQMRHSAEMHELSETDLALLAAVALYSPNCPGIRCPLLVESVQEKYLRALRAQLQSRPHSSDVFANVFVKLVMKLADLRARTTHLNCYFTGRGSQQKAMGPGGDLQTCVGGEMKKEVLSCGV